MDKSGAKQLRDALIVTLIPVAIALLMQKPALRQALAMKSAHYARRFCQAQADFWQSMATGAAQAYNRARL